MSDYPSWMTIYRWEPGGDAGHADFLQNLPSSTPGFSANPGGFCTPEYTLENTYSKNNIHQCCAYGEYVRIILQGNHWTVNTNNPTPPATHQSWQAMVNAGDGPPDGNEDAQLQSENHYGFPQGWHGGYYYNHQDIVAVEIAGSFAVSVSTVDMGPEYEPDRYFHTFHATRLINSVYTDWLYFSLPKIYATGIIPIIVPLFGLVMLSMSAVGIMLNQSAMTARRSRTKSA